MVTVISRRLKEILKERHISVKKLSEMCDLPFDTVNNICYGKSASPRISTLEAIADSLDISVDYLLDENPLSSEEEILLKHFRSCGKHGQHVISIVAEFEALSAKEERDAPNKHKVPCIIPCGDILKGIIYDSNNNKQIFTSNDLADIGILMISNDLAPHFYKDDVILFEKRFPKNGEYAGFYKNGRIYIREFIEEQNQYRLKPLYKGGIDLVFKRMGEIGFLGTYCGITEFKD